MSRTKRQLAYGVKGESEEIRFQVLHLPSGYYVWDAVKNEPVDGPWSKVIAMRKRKLWNRDYENGLLVEEEAREQNPRQCNPPFDLTQLSQLLGTKPITAQLIKVGKHIQLRIEKPTKELLYNLGLRKSKNPRARNFQKFDQHVWGSYKTQKSAEKAILCSYPSIVSMHGFVPGTFRVVRDAGMSKVVGDSQNPRKFWYSRDTLERMDGNTFRSVLEQEVYAGIPGDRAIPSDPAYVEVAQEVADYAGPGYLVARKGREYVFRIARRNPRKRRARK
jgi:hypothetical protein